MSRRAVADRACHQVIAIFAKLNQVAPLPATIMLVILGMLCVLFVADLAYGEECVHRLRRWMGAEDSTIPLSPLPRPPPPPLYQLCASAPLGGPRAGHHTHLPPPVRPRSSR